MASPQYTITEEHFTNEMNKGKTLVLKALRKKGFITKAEQEYLDSIIAIVPQKRNMFGKAVEKIFPPHEKDNHMEFAIVEMVDTEDKLDKLEPREEEIKDRFKNL